MCIKWYFNARKGENRCYRPVLTISEFRITCNEGNRFKGMRFSFSFQFYQAVKKNSSYSKFSDNIILNVLFSDQSFLNSHKKNQLTVDGIQ